MARCGIRNCYYGGDADVALKMGRIMNKFRPIAPKPVTPGSLSPQLIDLKSKSRRGKKKSSLLNRVKRGRIPTKKSVTETFRAFSEEKSNTEVVTLPLMPVTPERKEESPVGSSGSEGHVAVNCLEQKMGSSVSTYGSEVVVECVTDMWRGRVEIPAGLEKDTCPVFVSDAFNRVIWTNEGYRKMVVGSTRVAQVTRGMVPTKEEDVTCFTCSVRVRYMCRRTGKVVSMAAPCDVWRLPGGGLVWRLDVEAALGLSLGVEEKYYCSKYQ